MEKGNFNIFKIDKDRWNLVFEPHPNSELGKMHPNMQFGFTMTKSAMERIVKEYRGC